jgi:hypothetical protein
MNSACHHDHLLLSICLCIIYVFCHSQHIAIIAHNSVAQFLHFEHVPQRYTLVLLFFEGPYVVFEVFVGVGLEIGEKDYVIVILKGVTEREGVQIG